MKFRKCRQKSGKISFLIWTTNRLDQKWMKTGLSRYDRETVVGINLTRGRFKGSSMRHLELILTKQSGLLLSCWTCRCLSHRNETLVLCFTQLHVAGRDSKPHQPRKVVHGSVWFVDLAFALVRVLVLKISIFCQIVSQSWKKGPDIKVEANVQETMTSENNQSLKKQIENEILARHK